ncbi:MAG: LysM domain-containing protein [Verrucomicrobiota bacterium]
MRWRVILALSLLANLILALGWGAAKRAGQAQATSQLAATNSINSTNIRKAVIVRRQFFSWQELESQDYPTYIKNLREIGCPEQTIRDIIIADVTQMLAEKYRGVTTRLKPNPKWWTNHREPDAEAEDASQRMWAERASVLAQLLGPDWAVRNRAVPAAGTNVYQGLVVATMELNPVLQGLSAEKKQLVATILGQAFATANVPDLGWEQGRATRAAAEKERWTKLAEILTMEQLEAAKLHFSVQAMELRDELDALPGFETQPDEFRKIFRNTEAIEAQLAALAGRDDEAAQKQRATLNALRDSAIRSALSPERYELYVRLSDPAYLSALETLGEGRATPEAIRLLYAINRAKAAEEERIENDSTLTDTQKEIELKKLELEQLKAAALARGEELLDEAGQKEKPKPEPMKTHSALAGESLERIAFAYGVTPAQLRALNPTVNFDKLAAGTPINIPLYPLPPPPQ